MSTLNHYFTALGHKIDSCKVQFDKFNRLFSPNFRILADMYSNESDQPGSDIITKDIIEYV